MPSTVICQRSARRLSTLSLTRANPVGHVGVSPTKSSFGFVMSGESGQSLCPARLAFRKLVERRIVPLGASHDMRSVNTPCGTAGHGRDHADVGLGADVAALIG